MNPEPIQVCPDCRGTGWMPVSRDGIEGVSRCGCIKRSRSERLLENAKIPQRYAACEFINFDLSKTSNPYLQMAKLQAEKFVEHYPMSTPFGLLFVGPKGVGKTHLAVAVIKQLIRQKSVQCLFWTFPELLKEIQNSWNPISQGSELSLLQPILDIEVLVLDELGAQTPSSWVRDTVGYILNSRYNENKVTILTTNFLDRPDEAPTPKGVSNTMAERVGEQMRPDRAAMASSLRPDTLAQRIGEPMRSRLHEMCKTIRMDGNDFRETVKNTEHHF